jgi:hypothetical protein
MGMQDEAVGEPLERIKKAFAKALEDMEYPGLVTQRNEPDSNEEHFSRKVKDVEDTLGSYTPIFQEKILLAVLARLAEKKKAYEIEGQRQTAFDDLLDVTNEWPVEKIKKLTENLKNLIL